MSAEEYTLKFTVASALLRELGERLVGQPHIALAELIKNAYDADASRIEIRVDPAADRIEIVDNGHGMSAEEFERFWMCIGSTHKLKQRTSRNLGRPVTGSKGVGRLSVQFLARTIELITVSEHSEKQELSAFVDWDRAVEADSLTSAEAEIKIHPRQTRFPDDCPHGTRIVLEKLNQDWTTKDFEALARQVWWLQPPLAERLSKNDPKRFEIDLSSSNPELEEAFDLIRNTALNLWHARLRGRLVRDKNECYVELALEFAGGPRFVQRYPVQSNLLWEMKFDIRVFHLQHRQPQGISVKDIRDYLNEFGGVGIYDAGFRLPYYGPDQDWLGIEFDHAHRLHVSKLLPEELNVPRGLQFLPTNSRLFGYVEVNTSRERRKTPENERQKNRYLQIQVSRDRLVHNAAFQVLRNAVRWALDYYATRESVRSTEAKTPKPDEPATAKLRRVEDVLEDYKNEIPAQAFSQISTRIQEAVKATETEAEYNLARLELVGSLATAGMVALASEHEVNQQYRMLERLIAQLRKVGGNQSETLPLIDEIEAWLHRARASRALFTPLLDRESREDRQRYRAKAIVEDIVQRIAPLVRGLPIETRDIDRALRLPTATVASWNAIFQNVVLNAVNAMIDSDERRIAISSGFSRGKQCLWVQDTGAGVNLDDSAALFQPFERRLELSPARKRLGIGGTGLGLTIVKMLADQVGCDVGFVRPDDGFSTKFQISWKE